MAPSNKPICSNTSTALTYTSTPAGATYTWTSSSNASVSGESGGSGSSIDQVLINTSTTQQQVTYTIIPTIGTCPGASFSQVVLIDPTPSAFNVTGGGTFCTGGSPLTVGLSGSQNGLVYSLYRDNVFTDRTLNGTGSGLSFNDITTGGTYTIRATTGALCAAPMNASASVVVSAPPIGAGSLSGAAQLCIDGEETFTVSNVTGATEYTWSLPAGVEASPASTTASITVNITSEVSGNITVTPSNTCGNGAVVSKALSSLPRPVVSLIMPTGEVYINEEATFSFTSSADVSSVAWAFGDGQVSANLTPAITYTVPATYTVEVEVTDNVGCTGTASESLVVLPEATLSNFSVHNVVTANGDGKNAILKINDLDKFPGNEVIVIDRWGAEVFRQKNYANDWDFKKGSDYLPAGNYVCIVKSNGKSYSRTVTVLK